MKPILPNLALNDNALILNVIHYKPWNNKLITTDERYEDDCLIITYKDKHGAKGIKVIPKPKQEIWFTKPEYRHLWRLTRDSMEKEKLFPVEVRPRNIISRIYEELKDEDFEYSKNLKNIYNMSYQNNDTRMRKELHKYPHVFMSDFSIEDSYRLNLGLQYNLQEKVPIKKSFMDIETNVLGKTSEEIHEMHYDDITAVSLVLDYNPLDPKDDTIQAYGIFVRNTSEFPTQKEWEKNLSKFIKEAENMFNDRELTIGGKKFTHTQKYKVHIKIVGSEEELIKSYFELIHECNPDTNAIWNIAFDIPKIIARCQYLGLDPVELFSTPAIPKPIQHLSVSIDKRYNINLSSSNTYIEGTTPYIFIDQMLLYAGMTKGSPSPSHALDYVLERELGIGKVKFAPGVDITNVAQKDFWSFALYSLNDTVLMQILEHYLAHIELMLINTQLQCCSPLQTIRPTKQMRQYYSFEKMKRWNMIPGNNDNTDYLSNMTDELYDLLNDQAADDPDDETDIDEDELAQAKKHLGMTVKESIKRLEDSIDIKGRKLGGGMVLSPNNMENMGQDILGMPSKYFYRWAVDMDYAAEYPNIKVTRNLGKDTEIGRLVIEKKISDEQDMFKNDIYLPGAEFISDYIAGDILSMGRAYFNLPSVKEIISKYGRAEREND